MPPLQVDVCVQDCYSYTEAPESAAIAPSLADEASATPDTLGVTAEQWEIWFQQWLEQLQPDLSPIAAYELSLRLTRDREIHDLNAQYRQQDNPTDVLAFAALEVDCPASDEWQDHPLYLGDIVISVDTAQRQAIAQGHDLLTELAWLASHGLLHLLGWDHPDDESLHAMLTQQKALLHTVGVSVAAS